ncbi:MAG: response regulator [Planctomycetaceae bacterium]|nr:response regulator [Planctomycetaceae bacterium]
MESHKLQTSGGSAEPLSDKINDLFIYSEIIRWKYLPDIRAFDIPPTVLKHFGHGDAPSPLPMEYWLQIVHPSDRQMIESNFQELVSGKISRLDIVYRIRTIGSEYRYFRCRGGLNTVNSNPQETYISGTLQDVTEIEFAIRTLNKKDRLLKAVNTSIGILFNSYDSGFDRCMNEVLFLLGEALGADHYGIWTNTADADGRSYAKLFYEWSPNPKPAADGEYKNLYDYKEQLPFFQQVLQSGHTVNCFVKDLPEPERNGFAGKFVSILAVPIRNQEDFLGFITFGNYREEQMRDAFECDIMKSIGGIIASVIRRKEIETKLQLEQQVLNWVVDSAPCPILISSGGVVVRVNGITKDLFGINTGERADKIYPPEMKRSEVLKSIQSTGLFFQQSITYLCKDNKYRDFMVLVLPFRPHDIDELIFWATDITALKETEKGLIAAREKAEEAVKIKSEFLARMSHEIRTPMNAVIGMIYLCMQTNLSDSQRDYLAKATTAANNLLGIINDILDFSKIEANRVELEMIPFSIRKLLDDVSDLISIQILEKGLEFKVSIADEVEEFLIGDPLRLRQILINLLSNAVRFTSIGGIAINVIKVQSDSVLDESITLQFTVNDTGIGIPESRIDTIFESFVQAKDSISRKFGGTGLGLTIVKRLIELMNGEINVYSKENEGSEFVFTAVFFKAAANPEESSAVLLDRKRVLVVDDDENSCEILTKLMTANGMIVEAVNSGPTALDRLTYGFKAGQSFDLILIDWRMPQMDGIETIRNIHASSEIPPMHILMVSAYDRQDCIRLSSGLNVASVLLKPIDPVELKRTLKHVFLKEAKRVTEEKAADIRGAKILLAEDNKINQLVAEGLLNILGVNLTVVDNGRQAVEAVKNNDFDLILMDVQMPEMDGIEATIEIRALDKPGIDRLPILAMTANAMNTDYHKSLDAGMNDHLTKPIDPAKLRIALEKWIQR